MITKEILKQFALHLEHEPNAPASLALVVGGKSHRINDEEISPFLQKMVEILNQLIYEAKHIEMLKNIPSERYAEWEE